MSQLVWLPTSFIDEVRALHDSLLTLQASNVCNMSIAKDAPVIRHMKWFALEQFSIYCFIMDQSSSTTLVAAWP